MRSESHNDSNEAWQNWSCIPSFLVLAHLVKRYCKYTRPDIPGLHLLSQLNSKLVTCDRESFISRGLFLCCLVESEHHLHIPLVILIDFDNYNPNYLYLECKNSSMATTKAPNMNQHYWHLVINYNNTCQISWLLEWSFDRLVDSNGRHGVYITGMMMGQSETTSCPTYLGRSLQFPFVHQLQLASTTIERVSDAALAAGWARSISGQIRNILLEILATKWKQSVHCWLLVYYKAFLYHPFQ